MKYLLMMILLCVIFSSTLYGKEKIQDSLRIEVARIKTQNDLQEKKIDDFEQNLNKIIELKNELSNVNINLVNSKKEIYDSHISTLNFFLTVVGIIIAFLGVIGYRSISGRISDVKKEIEREINLLDNRVSEIKDDINVRVSNIKDDINVRVSDIKFELNDFKRDQKEEYSKFEKSSTEKINEGLAYQLQEAIDRIIKGSLGKEIKTLEEQVAELSSTIEQIKTENQRYDQNNDIPTEMNGNKVTGTKHTNAFEDEK